MLLHVQEKPYMLRHGTGCAIHCLNLLRLSDKNKAAFEESLDELLPVTDVGRREFVALSLESDAEIGEIGKNLYNPEKNRWTATIALMRFK